MHFELPLRMGASCQFCVKINEAKWQFNQGVSYVRVAATTTHTTTTATTTMRASESCNIWGTMRICSSRIFFCLPVIVRARRVASCALHELTGSWRRRRCCLFVSASAFVSRKSRTGCKCFWHLTGDALTAIKVHSASGRGKAKTSQAKLS